MGNFQPSVGDRTKPLKVIVPKGEESSQNKVCHDVTPFNSSRRAWPRWVWVAVAAFFGLWCIGFYVFYVTEERLAYGSAILNNVWQTTEIRHWSWWYWPVFWCIVIFTVVRLLLLHRLKSPDVQDIKQE